MSEMTMMMATTMTNSPQESTESESSRRESTESDSSRRDSTTSSSDLSDGSHGSSCSPPLKRPRLEDLRNATIIDGVDLKKLSDEEYIEHFVSLALSLEPEVVSPRLPVDVMSMYAKLALSYYKDTKGNDFEFTRNRSMAPFPPREERPEGGTHFNFFARPIGSEQEYLFYGEVQHIPKDPEVVECYKFPCGTDAGIDLILHPPLVDCPYCEYNILGRELDDDEDYE